MKYLAMFLFIVNMTIMETCVTPQAEESIETEATDLEYLVREAKESGTKAPILVLLHGYGSNMDDLFSLSTHIPDDWLVVSVQAPNNVSKDQYKWYDIKMANDEIIGNLADEKESRAAIIKLIDQLIVRYNGDSDKVVVAGFSQGAIMSLNLMLTNPDRILSAGCFSGRMMKGIKPMVKDMRSLKSKQVFISHGTKDQMLPIHNAVECQAQLEKWGVDVTTITDEVAHTISGKQLGVFVTWLTAL